MRSSEEVIAYLRALGLSEPAGARCSGLSLSVSRITSYAPGAVTGKPGFFRLAGRRSRSGLQIAARATEKKSG